MDFRKQLNNKPSVSNSDTDMAIFSDESFSFVYKKTENISTAIYLITNLMNPEEPIKWQLRQTSIDLIDRTMSLSNATLSSKDMVLRDISQELFQLISLYKVSYRSGFISQMNYEIVNKELGNLANFINQYSKEDSDSRNNLFDEDFFEKDIENGKSHIKEDFTTKDLIKQRQTDSVKDNVFNKRHNKRQENEQNKKVSFTNKSQERNKRRDSIIEIIKQKKDVSVKDISNIIKDTSEKTLQRELVSMVEDGVLKKEGERRWSRYMLKN